jgi:hypothetical protein
LIGNARSQRRLKHHAVRPPEQFDFMSAQRVNIHTATFFGRNKKMPRPSVYEHHTSILFTFLWLKSCISVDIVLP